MFEKEIENRPDILQSFSAQAADYGLTQNYGTRLYKQQYGPTEYTMYLDVDVPEKDEKWLFVVFDTRDGVVFERIP